jgi:hypothetical protein
MFVFLTRAPTSGNPRPERLKYPVSGNLTPDLKYAATAADWYEGWAAMSENPPPDAKPEMA